MAGERAEVRFPEGFLWGTATSSHQIEGGNWNNDWWDWEHNPASGCAESSGDACDSFHRWREDIELVASMGLGAYRFSLEWSRIEPAEGEWSVAALDHYRRMLAACHELGVAPVVTFHHFTIPRWLAARGGWEAPDAPELFARYVLPRFEQRNRWRSQSMDWMRGNRAGFSAKRKDATAKAVEKHFAQKRLEERG